MAARRMGSEVRRGAAELGSSVREHPLVAGLVGAAGIAVGTTGVVLRRLTTSSASTPGTLAEATAISVWDAAKGAVIDEVRATTGEPGLATIESPIRQAVRDAADAGADITAAALGSVEGAANVSRLLRVSHHEAITFAAATALDAAHEIGRPAAIRVAAALRDQFDIDVSA